MPKPLPAERPSRRLSPALVDRDRRLRRGTSDPRAAHDRVAPARRRFGGWKVLHGGVYRVLVRARLHRVSIRLAAAELLAAAEGGPVT